MEPPDVDSDTSTGIAQWHSALDVSLDSWVVVLDTVGNPSYPMSDARNTGTAIRAPAC